MKLNKIQTEKFVKNKKQLGKREKSYHHRHQTKEKTDTNIVPSISSIFFSPFLFPISSESVSFSSLLR